MATNKEIKNKLTQLTQKSFEKWNEVKNYFDGLREETDGRITKSIQGLVLNPWGTEVKKEKSYRAP